MAAIMPLELTSTVFLERHGRRLYVATLFGRIVGGWAVGREPPACSALFFGLVDAVSTSIYMDDRGSK